MTGHEDVPTPDHGGMPKGFDDFELLLGDILRGERATMGKSLLDVQRETKIKASYIAAIEECDLSVFETPGFIAGYVRSYGRYLGLDPDLVYSAFCEQSGFSHLEGLEARVHAKDKARPSSRARALPRPVKTSASDPVLARNPLYTAPRDNPFADIRPGAVASVAALLLLLGGLGYGGLSLLQSIQRVTLAPVETPVVTLEAGPRQADDVAGSLQEELASAPSGEALLRLYRPQALETPVLVPRDGPIATLDPDAQGAFARLGQATARAVETAALPTAPSALDRYLPEIQGPPLPAEPQEQQVAVLAPDAPEMVLIARDPVWIRVRAADGTVLLEKILNGGERYVVPALEEPAQLRSGNSGSLFFLVNGQTLGPAGPAGAVVKDVQLSVAELDARYEPADLSADPELKRLAELAIAGDGAAE